MSKKFFTNQDGNTLEKKFKGIFEGFKPHFFDILVGYFRASGYFMIKDFIDEVKQVRILVGINTDALIAKAKAKGVQYLIQPESAKDEFKKAIINDIQNANYDKKTEEGIIQFIEDLISGKIQVKAHPDKNIHAKIYIFRAEKLDEHTPCAMITGSSNLTVQGLAKNIEFNVELRDYEDVAFAHKHFEELWAKGIDILPIDIAQLKKKTWLNDEITPFELYIKMLMEYFGKSVDNDLSVFNILPEKYDKLAYQADAINDGFNRLMAHNGFILADVVGLGKTIVATAIIRKFINYNGNHTKILIVYPPALETNWKNTVRDFNLRNYVDFITNGSLHKIVLQSDNNYQKPEDYDLIVIDESHKFRNDSSQMYAWLQLVCKTPRRNMGNDQNRNKKVILLSATPLNNRPEDIANQVYLFQDSRKSTIEGVPNLQSFFSKRIEEYKAIKKQPQLDIEKLKEVYRKIRDSVLIPLVIRRTREDIKNSAAFWKDMEKQGITFPEVKDPNMIQYEFDKKLSKLFYDTVFMLTDEDKLQYFRYRAIEFLTDEHQEKYENAIRISRQLAEIMRTMLVKRLESSFFAFKETLKRFAQRNQFMIDMFEKDKVYIAPDIDVNKFLENDDEEGLEKLIREINEDSPNNDIYKASDFKEGFLDGLQKDQKILEKLVQRWNEVEKDPKLDTFLAHIKTQLLNEKNIEKKLVIFTESTETANYLKSKLMVAGYEKTLAISSTNRKAMFRTIQANFDAKLDIEHQKNDYEFLITTDVLAEGINLHRSNVIVNYDIPWNTTRLMQRIGRVNRLGTKAKEIVTYNFYPTAESEEEIALNKISLQKLQSFHSAFSEDSKIYSVLEELEVNKLGETKGESDKDRRLEYLEFLRKFKAENPNDYKKISKMPMRSRTARAVEIDGQLGTLVYLRTQKRDAFYFVTDKAVKELTFLEAVELFKAKPDEKPYKLPENYHEHIGKASDYFKRNIAIQSDDYFSMEDLGIAERNAINLLKTFADAPQLTDEQRKLIKAAITVIYQGIFRKFRNELNQISKESKKKGSNLKETFDKLMKVIHAYPIKMIQHLEELRLEEQREAKEQDIFEEPSIIISESFTD